MSVTLKIMRRFVGLVSTSILCAVSLSPWLSGCGGAPDVAKAPKAAQVVWGSHEEAGEPDAPAPAGDSQRAAPVEVDLDAPTEVKAPARDETAPTKAGSAAVVSPEPEPEPEPAPEAEAPAPEPPAAVEPPAAAPALDKELRAAVNKQKKAAAEKSAPKKAASKKTAAKGPAPKQPSVKTSAPAAPVASTYSGANACKTTHFSVARVRDACATGGRGAAKAVMRDAIGKALASGASLKCGNCHAEQQNYTLKPDAVAQLERWLAR